MTKELKSLLVSAEAVAEDALVDALGGDVSIIEGTGEVMALPGLSKRDLSSQIIAYLLALRAAVILQQRQSAEATPRLLRPLFTSTSNAFARHCLGLRERSSQRLRTVIKFPSLGFKRLAS